LEFRECTPTDPASPGCIGEKDPTDPEGAVWEDIEFHTCKGSSVFDGCKFEFTAEARDINTLLEVSAQSAKTSLERAFYAAFNAVVNDGGWSEAFGSIEGFTQSDHCNGGTVQAEFPARHPGTDLDAVLNNQKFICGYVGNSEYLWPRDSSQTLLNTTVDPATGTLVEFYDQIAAKIGEAYGVSEFAIEWDLTYTKSDDVLDAVLTGEFDAACARWSQGGVVTRFNQESPRTANLSPFHCTTYIAEQSVAVASNSSLDSFEAIATAAVNGDVEVCTVSPAGGGTSQTCSSIMTIFGGGDVECLGKSAQAWDDHIAGTGCEVVWGSLHPTDSSAVKLFATPVFDTTSSFFRRQDLSECEDYQPTSMEQAFQAAFNEAVSAGEWTNTFGGIAGIYQATSCNGGDTQSQYPPVAPGSDLDRLLNAKKFICGYNSDSHVTAPEDSSIDLILTDQTTASGLVVDFYDILAANIAAAYGVPDFVIEWDVSKGSSNDILNAVATGEFDGACGRYGQGGTWTVPQNGQKFARANAFSGFHCETYINDNNVLIQPGAYASFSELASAAVAGEATICSTTSPGGGTSQTCSAIFSNFGGGSVECQGKRDQAWIDFNSGVCTAVFQSLPTEEDNVSAYDLLPTPVQSTPATFFRQFDLDD